MFAKKKGSDIPDRRPRLMERFGGDANTYISIIFLAILLFAIFCLVVPDFSRIRNIVNLSRRSAIKIIVAIGMTFVLLCGEIDLSIPGIISFVGVVTAILLKANWPVVVCVLTALLIGTCLGLINGLLTIKIPSFIATLGMLSITRGLSLYITNGYSINGFDERFLALDRLELAGIPLPVILVVVVIALGVIFSRYMVVGRQLYALGGNRTAARSSGVPINLRLIQTFVILGFLSAFCSLLLIAKVNAAYPLMEADASFDAITAVVIGGTSLFGGRGHIVGSVAGALIITMLSNVFTLLSLPAALQGVIFGVILIAVIFVDHLRTKQV
jgi:ribose/xylose/arabinose/galactoside ABC-type transport system permease subunit